MSRSGCRRPPPRRHGSRPAWPGLARLGPAAGAWEPFGVLLPTWARPSAPRARPLARFGSHPGLHITLLIVLRLDGTAARTAGLLQQDEAAARGDRDRFGSAGSAEFAAQRR